MANMRDDQSYESAFPSSRQFTFDFGELSRRKHHVLGLLEVDVTDARTRIRHMRRSDKSVSFFAWLVKTVADCVAVNPQVNGYKSPQGNKVILFKDVDISLPVEKNVDGVRVPLPYVIRDAERKTVSQIHQEIEAAKSEGVEDESNYILGEKYSALGMKMLVSLPQWLRLALSRIFLFNNPTRMKGMMGTVVITTVGMVGHVNGWIVPFGMHTICLGLGSLNQQPSVYKGEIQKREILHLTMLIDHDVVDGVPAARFTDDLVRKLESAAGI